VEASDHKAIYCGAERGIKVYVMVMEMSMMRMGGLKSLGRRRMGSGTMKEYQEIVRVIEQRLGLGE